MQFDSIKLDSIIYGGQTIGALPDGKKALIWGGLPGETVNIAITKKRSSYVEGYVTDVIHASPDRVEPTEPDSYLSTSPWQIMSMGAESRYKSQLIDEAFRLHHISLPNPSDIFTDEKAYGYRNKIEFSFWWDNDTNQIELAFFRRGTHGKIAVEGSALANPAINQAAHRLLSILRAHGTIRASQLKTVIVRCSADGTVSMQLYVKDTLFPLFNAEELTALDVHGFELIYSNPKSPASVITSRLQQWGEPSLTDTILDISFRYATEGFFQINIPLYEQALRDMKQWIPEDQPVLDLYSGVGSIGLTIGGSNITMVESNEHAVREMNQNIDRLNRKGSAIAIHAASEAVLETITSDMTIIVDPPRAGLHQDVVTRLLEVEPARIIYLSCNPVTQGRDTELLLERYRIIENKSYNFFPRTPHIESLIVLEKQD